MFFFYIENYIRKMKKNQESKTYLEKITDRKLKNEKLLNVASSLKNKEKIRMSKNVIQNIKDCGTWMEFLADKKLEHLKLYQGVFCDNRFCPICSKRKAKKDAVQIKIMTEYIKYELNREFILLTLTAPNVNGEQLSEEIVKYNKAFNHFMKLKKYKNVIKGYIRKLEVTYNNKKKDKSYNTYHPHFHVLISVDKSYFKKNYIKQQEWLINWQEVMDDSSITQVDVRRLKTKTKDQLDKSILELTKYIAKDSNYLENEQVFEYFYKGLKSKRQYAFGGDFKVAREKLKNGELKKYYIKDETEWYWKLTNKWQNGQYSEKQEKLTEQEKAKLQKEKK